MSVVRKPTGAVVDVPAGDLRVRVPVWDLPTRIIHWCIVLLVAVSWWTAETGALEYHRFSGYAVLTLMLWRIYWGFAGSPASRFRDFVRGPDAVMRYVRTQLLSRTQLTMGHNPLGGWSAIAMLTLLLLQPLLGLFCVDVDGIESGPMSFLIDFDLGRRCASWHELLFNVLLLMIALHLAAVAFYLAYKGENLTRAMVSGSKYTLGGQVDYSAFAPIKRAVVGLALAIAVVVVLVNVEWFLHR